MKLTTKDKEFLSRLKNEFEASELSIELKNDGYKRMVLSKNYGTRIETAFDMTRQGVRWRFDRLFNEIYVSAYESLFWIENQFGTHLRSMALEVAQERIKDHRNSELRNQSTICRRQIK